MTGCGLPRQRRSQLPAPCLLLLWLPSVSALLPSEGEQKVLVVPIDFEDAEGRITGTRWNEMFFGDGGMSEFYSQNSYGKLQLSGEVVGLNNSGDLAINSPDINYVRLDHPLDFYEGETSSGGDCLRGSLVRDALLRLDAAGFDFTPYATDGWIESLIVMPAQSGRSFVGSLSWHFEACRPTDSEDENPANTESVQLSGGVGVKRFSACYARDWNEVSIQALATCVHEEGHVLGLPDYYDYSDSCSDQEHGVSGSMMLGLFALMAGGGLSDLKEYPSNMSPYSKKDLGWLDPIEVERSWVEVEYKLRPAQDYPDVLSFNIEGTRQYFLVDNRQELLFNKLEETGELHDHFCPGIVIWHVDQEVLDSSSFGPNTLCRGHHPGLSIEEGDGDASLRSHHWWRNHVQCNDTWKEGAVWSGKAAKLWDGSDSGASIRVGSTDANGAVTVYVTCTRCPGSATPPPTTTPEFPITTTTERWTTTEHPECNCDWTLNPWGCGTDDGSSCWSHCCGAPDCSCEWSMGPYGCGHSDGSDCWKHCCSGPECSCDWAQGQHGCGHSDGSECWDHCCGDHGGGSKCNCDWTSGEHGCGSDDGTECWAHCCAEAHCSCDWFEESHGCGVDDGTACWMHCCGTGASSMESEQRLFGLFDFDAPVLRTSPASFPFLAASFFLLGSFATFSRLILRCRRQQRPAAGVEGLGLLDAQEEFLQA